MPDTLEIEDSDNFFMCGALQPCGFLVQEWYFAAKPRIARTTCPRCGKGAIVVVDRQMVRRPGFFLNWETGQIKRTPAGGSFVEASAAAAVAVLGYDMLRNKPEYKTAPFARRLVAVGLAGSAAAGDSELSIKVGTNEVARIFNSGTGFPDRNAMKRVGVLVPAGTPITAEVVDAAGTNPLNLALDIVP